MTYILCKNCQTTEKLHKRNVQLADLKNKLIKAQDRALSLEEDNKDLERQVQKLLANRARF